MIKPFEQRVLENFHPKNKQQMHIFFLGDALTSYFMIKASGKRRRNKIISLRQEDKIIQE